MANAVRVSGVDRKWDELSKLLQDDSKCLPPMVSGKAHYLRSTGTPLRYLTDKIRTLFGHDDAVVTIHGGMVRDERRKVEELFKQDRRCASSLPLMLPVKASIYKERT